MMGTKTVAGVPTAAALKLLKLRRQGMEGPALVAAMGLTPARVDEVLGKLGWPDLAVVDRQIRELEEILAMGPSTPAPAAPEPGTDSAPKADPPGPTAPAAEEAAIEVLIARGAKSPRKGTQALAHRVREAAVKLREVLAAEEAARRETAAVAAKRAKLQSEIKKRRAEAEALEKELATLAGTSSPSAVKRSAAARSACQKAGVEPAAVRAWAEANGVELKSVKIPQSVVDQYLTAMGGAV